MSKEENNNTPKQIRIDKDIYPLLKLDASHNKRSAAKQVNAILAVRYGMADPGMLADVDEEIRALVAAGKEETARTGNAAGVKSGSKKR